MERVDKIWILYFLLCCLAMAVMARKCHAQVVCLTENGFTVEYDTVMHSPRCVYWLLRSSDISGKVRRSANHFVDTDKMGGVVVSESLYRYSGYDKGHLCPSADRTCCKAHNRATFSMLNVCPQAPELNRGQWKRLEDACRRYVKGGHFLRVVASPVWCAADTTFIGGGIVPVPHAFVKTIYLDGTDSIVCARLFYNQ